MPSIRSLLPVLWEKSGGICALCKKPMQPIAAELHIDHIVPRVLGGTNDIDNLQAVHPICNRRKRHLPMDVVVERIRLRPEVEPRRLQPGQTLVSFLVDPELLRRLKDWQFDNRIPSRTEALRRLLQEGFRLGVRPDRD